MTINKEETILELQQESTINFGAWVSGFDVHDALDLRSVEGIDDGLSLCDLVLGLAVREGGGERVPVRQGPVLAKPVDGSALGVLPYVVVGELPGRA